MSLRDAILGSPQPAPPPPMADPLSAMEAIADQLALARAALDRATKLFAAHVATYAPLEPGGECAHRDRAVVQTFAGAQFVCPDCGATGEERR